MDITAPRFEAEDLCPLCAKPFKSEQCPHSFGDAQQALGDKDFLDSNIFYDKVRQIVMKILKEPLD